MSLKKYKIIGDNMNIDYLIMKKEICTNSFLKPILLHKDKFCFRKDKNI